jgi:transcriptional regulator with XRE-family HTH domain
MNADDRFDIVNMVCDLDASSEGVELDLRLDVASIIIQAMKIAGKTQRQLAVDAGMSPATLSRILHSNQNLRLDTIAKILHALGVKGRIAARHSLTHLPPAWSDPESAPSPSGATNGRKSDQVTQHQASAGQSSEAGTGSIYLEQSSAERPANSRSYVGRSNDVLPSRRLRGRSAFVRRGDAGTRDASGCSTYFSERAPSQANG